MLGTLLSVTDKATAERLSPRFNWTVIAQSVADHWARDAGHVSGWRQWAVGTDDLVGLAVEER